MLKGVISRKREIMEQDKAKNPLNYIPYEKRELDLYDICLYPQEIQEQ
jgi:hypothetical protein